MENSIFKLLKFKDIFSLINMILGFYSIILIFNNEFFYASLILLLSTFFDFFDGFYTKKFSFPTNFGKYLDALSDTISFGVSPALFTYFLLINFYENYVCIFLSLFILTTGILRLARYLYLNMQEFYIGLPITFNGLLIPILYFILEITKINIIFIIIIIISSILMISKIKIKKYF